MFNKSTPRKVVQPLNLKEQYNWQTLVKKSLGISKGENIFDATTSRGPAKFILLSLDNIISENEFKQFTRNTIGDIYYDGNINVLREYIMARLSDREFSDELTKANLNNLTIIYSSPDEEFNLAMDEIAKTIDESVVKIILTFNKYSEMLSPKYNSELSEITDEVSLLKDNAIALKEIVLKSKK